MAKKQIAKAAEPSKPAPVAVDAAVVAPSDTEPSTPPGIEVDAEHETNGLGERGDVQAALAVVPEPMAPLPLAVDDDQAQRAVGVGMTMASDASCDEGDHPVADVTPTQASKKQPKSKAERKRKPPSNADKPTAKRSLRSTRSDPVAA